MHASYPAQSAAVAHSTASSQCPSAAHTAAGEGEPLGEADGDTLGDSVHAHPAQLWPILVNASHVYASCAKNHSSQFFGSCG